MLGGASLASKRVLIQSILHHQTVKEGALLGLTLLLKSIRLGKASKNLQ